MRRIASAIPWVSIIPMVTSSIYDALVVTVWLRDFKKGMPLVSPATAISFGSIKVMRAAAMRCTEARSQKVTQEVFLADL
ncbi:MAG: hypothetical protein ACLR1V_01790 [Coprococcus sp.]